MICATFPHNITFHALHRRVNAAGLSKSDISYPNRTFGVTGAWFRRELGVTLYRCLNRRGRFSCWLKAILAAISFTLLPRSQSDIWCDWGMVSQGTGGDLISLFESAG